MEKLEKQFDLEIVRELIGLHRSLILNCVESVYGASEEWPVVRNRLLSYLGNRGFEGQIISHLQKRDPGGKPR